MTFDVTLGYEGQRSVDTGAPSHNAMLEPPPVRCPSHELVEVELDDDPWPAIRRNYVYLSQRLYFDPLFLGCLFEQHLISRDDFELLSKDSVSNAEKTRRFLTDILPSKPPSLFATFCDILRSINQAHVADRLIRNPLEFQLFPLGHAQGISVHIVPHWFLVYCLFYRGSKLAKSREFARAGRISYGSSS